MPTVNAFRIMKLRSLSTTSWAVCVGNQGDRMISKPSSMPHQSSQVLWVPKSRKSDIVDLLLKKAYVSGRRAPHPMVRRPVRPHRERMSYKTWEPFRSLQERPGTIFARAPKRNDRRDDMTDTVNNNTARHSFELEVEGRQAAAYYEREGDVIIFKHTEVPAELGGKGVGSRLVKGALDQVRAEGLQVVAQCPFVNAWIGKNPAYADLLKP